MKRIHILFVIGLVLGAGIVVATNDFGPGEAVKISDNVTVQSPNGLELTMQGTTNVSMEDLFQGGGSEIVVNMSEGNITLASADSVSATIHKNTITGEWTNVTDITAGSNWLEIYPESKQRVDTRGDVNDIAIKSAALDDGTTDFWYNGTDGGVVTVRIYDLPENTRIAAIDESDTFKDVNRTDGSGTLWLDLDASSHSIELLDVNDTRSAPTQSNAGPTGLIPDTPSELSIDINDSDFPADEVNVSIYLDGNEIHQENITSNGTVTTSNFGSLDLGEHTWAVNATDYYGNVNNQTYDFSLPSNITLRNETNASQVITDQNVTATFYTPNGETIIQRSDSNGDGNISLRGLPDESFVVTFTGDGWHDRRAFIESIGNQQNIYLLNSTAYPTADDSAIETTFIYEDRTNQFEQSNTTLRIQRAVDPDNDGNFTFQTVAGDFWGAAGEFPFTGEYQARYRLVIQNEQTGDRRVLGTHIPTSDGVKNIIVGRIIFEAENSTGRWFDAQVNQSEQRVEAVYNDPTNQTTDLRVRVYERNNQSNVIFDQTFSGDFGRKVVTVALTENQTGTDWVVDFDGTHSEDGSVGGELIAGGDNEYGLPLDPSILYSLAYIFVTFIMALYGPRTALLGAWAGVFVVGGFMFIGWINVGIPAYTVGILIAIGGTFYHEAMP